jgi:AraC-like DNA-binding protein
MISVARAEWDLVFWETPDGIGAGVRGPESIATRAPVPEHAEFLGIRFALGTLLSDRPASMLVDRFLDLPRTGSGRFVVDGVRLRLPEYDDAEELVDRLLHAGRITRAPIERALGAVTTRTQQRWFAAATGMTRGAVRQITRAQHAATRLQAGTSPLAVVHDLGYYDQPHMARSLRRFVGATATELASGATSHPLSLLYKTEPDSEP